MKDRYGWARAILDQALYDLEGFRDQETRDSILDAAYVKLRDGGVSHWRYLWMLTRAMKHREKIMYLRALVEDNDHVIS